MDERIKNLKSTTFYGQRFTRKQLCEIQQTVELFPRLSRHELAQTICEHLGWQTFKGDNRHQSARRLLERLESVGVLQLPPKQENQQRGAHKPLQWTVRTEPQSEVAVDLSELLPLSLQCATAADEKCEFNEWVDRYHYLGYKRPIGPSLRYYIVDRHGRKLGCVLFQYAVKTLPCRDRWIGWQDQVHKKRLQWVINNSRFVLFPWVRVKNLASKVLSMVAKQLPDDWQREHGYRPVLMETFVDETRYSASSYRAANWHYLGTTDKRSGKTRKGVYAYPLERDFREFLRTGKSAPVKRGKKRAKAPKISLDASDPLLEVWRRTLDIMAEVAAEFDARWQRRRRVLNTLLVMLFIFRVVFSHHRQGYGSTLEELWRQCQQLQIALPQAQPVSAAAMCKARQKLDEEVFKVLQRRIVAQNWPHQAQHLWHGHRLYAVDGSKINLPFELRHAGYQASHSKAHYPQALVSCLYRVKERIPVDFEMVSHGDESALARMHLLQLRAEDVVVYDRNYYSYGMLHQHWRRGLHAIFRLQKNSGTQIDAFINSPATDVVITLNATRHMRSSWRSEDGDMPSAQRVRLVKYEHGGTTFRLATTLLDQNRYCIQHLSDAYHARWGVEEMYKTSKTFLAIEPFHAKSERGVKQELYAHFVLVTLLRQLTNYTEAELRQQLPVHPTKSVRVNFKHALALFSSQLEELLLQQTQLLNNAIANILNKIGANRYRERLNRSYARESKQPRSKWTRRAKLDKAAEHTSS